MAGRIEEAFRARRLLRRLPPLLPAALALAMTPLLMGDVAPYPPGEKEGAEEEPPAPEVLTPSVIEERIGQDSWARRCFTEGDIPRDASVTTVWVKFHVEPGGDVFGAHLIAPDSLVDSPLAVCLADAVDRVQFPPTDSSGPRAVKYPFMVPAPENDGGDPRIVPDEDLPPAGPSILAPPILPKYVGGNEDIKRCFEEARNADPPHLSPRTKVWARFTVAPDGTVSDAGLVTDEFVGTELDTCVSTALNALVFPSFTGDQPKTVKYPFVLP